MKIQNGIYYDFDNLLQSPFRQQDLLTASGFVELCEENDIDTSEKALQFYEREGLFLPALRVDVGYRMLRKIFANFDGTEDWRFVDAEDLEKFKYKKLDKETYYRPGGFSLKQPNCLDWHFSHNMIFYPSEKGWQEIYDSTPSSAYYVTNPIELGELTEPLYMPHQMFAVEIIQKFLNPRLIQGLHFLTKDWQKVKIKVLENYSQEIRESNIRKIAEEYKFFTFYLFVLSEFEAKNQEYYNQLIEAKGDKDLVTEIILDWSNDADTTVKDILLSYMKQFGFTQEDILNRRTDMLVNGSFWGMHSKKRDIYLAKLTEEDLYQTEYAYWVVKILNWLLNRIGQKEITVIDLILRGRLCKNCRKLLIGPRKNQFYCNDPECQRIRENETKRIGYKSGHYTKPTKKAKSVEFK